MPHAWPLSALCIDLCKEFPVMEFEGYLIITKFQYYKPRQFIQPEILSLFTLAVLVTSWPSHLREFRCQNIPRYGETK
jgi:hypothetical protein